MLLFTTWYGTFIFKDGEFIDSKTFPKDAKEIAKRMQAIGKGEILDEEREIAQDITNFLVLDKKEYRDRAREIGKAFRKHLGRHFPAMTLAEVKGLWDDEAKIEIEAVAMIP